jgi:hypothetical protein
MFTLALVLPALTVFAESPIRKVGKLTLPEGAALMAFCSDPTLEQVLTQDFHAAKRAADSNASTVTTLTVSVTQQLLKPGVSMSRIAPGDPQVADLLKSAGASPPPLGDTGSELDQAVVARAVAQRGLQPADTPMQQMLNKLEGHGDLGPPPPCDENPQPGCVQPTPKPQPGSAGYTGDVQDYMHRDDPTHQMHHDDDRAYDTIVVARASLSGSPDELTVVAVIHPGDDVNEVKKLVAEEIANALLH